MTGEPTYLLDQGVTLPPPSDPAVCEECGVRAERQPMSRTYAIDHHPDCTEGKPAPVPGGEEAF